MSAATVLVCDDEELIRWSLTQTLAKEGFRTLSAANGQEAVEQVEQNAPNLVLMDLKMPVMDGITALQEIRSRGNEVPVIVLTAHGGVDSAIKATQLGAAAYLTKPFDLREVTLQVKKALSDAELKREVHVLRDQERTGYGSFVGSSPVLEPVFATLARLEEVDAPTILVTGESRHRQGCHRAHHPHPGATAQRTLRGGRLRLAARAAHRERAVRPRAGRVHRRPTDHEAGHVRGRLGSGTIFLDEIGEMSLNTQAKLLRSLESRTFKRVGGIAPIHMDVALIAATNRNLRAEVDAGRFREDLYFRLHVIPIHLPALRERPEDIPLLVGHFLERFNREFGQGVRGVSGAAMQMLQQYNWPGNVRELRNVLERIVILRSAGEVLEPDALPSEVRYASAPIEETQRGCPFTLPEEGVDLEAVERGLLAQALRRTGGNQSAAARLLGISRYALRYRMEKYDLT